MFDFGDELTIQSYRIPWLIWTQILVLLLLIFLLYCFSFDDESNASSSSSTASSSTSDGCSRDLDHKLLLKKCVGNTPTTVTDYVHHCQGFRLVFCIPLAKVIGSQSIKGEMATMTGRRIEREDFAEGDSITVYHPCNYFRLAKLAFLKCLGLDCEPERSLNTEENKKKRR